MDNRIKILDIAMNLNRIGNWAADDYTAKKDRIRMFLDSTTQQINDINEKSLPRPFKNTFDSFLMSYPKLFREGMTKPHNSLEWAEQMMTWGNILTHRSALLK